MQVKTIPAVLSIAGSDSSGGAGIQADIKTIAAHHLFAETAITALTAQNTTGVRAVLEATPEFVAQEIDAVFEDIPPAAVKIGMVSSAAIIETIAERLEHWGARNIVVDPVMVATSGARLIDEGAIEALTARLLPIATVITPNIMEAEALAGRAIENVEAGSELIGSASSNMEEAVTSIEDIKTAMSSIAHASEQQLEAVAQIQESMDSLSQVVQENSAASEESAVIGEELADRANELKHLIGRFKIDADPHESEAGA